MSTRDASLTRDGFAIVPDALDAPAVDALLTAVAPLADVAAGTRGGILVFHSLLLHASSPAQDASHRRVVHVEYAAAEWAELPGGLAWHERH